MTDAFAKIVPQYPGRTGYLQEFFKELVRELKLGPHSRILDVACGSGELAKGLSPHVGEVIAVDKSEAMLSAACEDAAANIVFRQAEIGANNDLNLGRFDAITVGRALRYLPRDVTVRFFEQSLPKGAFVVACIAGISTLTPWQKGYDDVRRRYGYRKGAEGFQELNYFANSLFEPFKQPYYTAQVNFTLDSLVENALSFRSSHETIGNNLPAFRIDLEKTLRHHLNGDGSLTGTVGSGGTIFRKK